MKIALLVLVMALLVLGPAQANNGRSGQTTVSFLVGAKPVTVRTSVAVAPAARLKSAVSLNGQIPTSCWADSQLQIECGWHGVLITIGGQRTRGPATVRAVSLRTDSVRVFVRLDW